MSTEDSPIEKFSVVLFLIINTLTLLAILSIIAVTAPQVWHAQIQSPWWMLLVVFLSCHLVNCFGEYFFHRYMLHASLVPGFSKLWRQHTHHHAITRIHPRKTPAEESVLVENFYPIVSPEQHEASFFPWYSLLGFCVFASIFLIPIQMMLPKAPILLGGYCSIGWSMLLYEIIHAIEHKPMSFWNRGFENKVFGRLLRKLYSFHQGHHADIKRNEGISGFFGIPLADMLFRTLCLPKTVLEHSTEVPRTEFVPPKPIWLIRWLDKIAHKAHQNPRLRAS